MGLIRRLASRAEVPVFPVVGAGGRIRAAELDLLEGIRTVSSPREAAVLLVVGDLTRALIRPALTVHDQLGLPRATVWWPAGDRRDLAEVWPDLVVGRPGDGEGVRQVFVELIDGSRPSDPPLLLDIDPAPWRGLGPYGHGGTGMTGGVPYGRPLPSRAPDPDGLELDQLPLHLGPHLPLFPPGLVLDVALQGDVIREAAVGDNPFRPWPGDPQPGPLDTVTFVDALVAPAPVAALEMARARHHLRWLAGALRVHGLAALAARLLRLASSLDADDRAEVEALARRVRRSRSLTSATEGIGVLDDSAAWPAGPGARAAGGEDDARSADPAYQALDFAPVTTTGGDARARMLQRVDEAVQALDLADRAADAVRTPGPALEGPRGPLSIDGPLPSPALLALLPRLLPGQEWGDALTALVSLDVDLEEAAVSELAPVR